MRIPRIISENEECQEKTLDIAPGVVYDIRGLREDYVMERIVRQTMLFDFYGELLTEHQRNAYEDVVMNDLSYAELARLQNISRQAAYDMIRRCDKQLEEYEEKLHLVERFLRIREQMKEIEATARKLQGASTDPKVRESAEQILQKTDSIINEL